MREIKKQLVILFVFFSLMCSATSVSSQNFARYCNDRYGFCLDYPSNLTMEPPPANNDGRRFHDSRGFLLIVSGINNVLENTIDTEMASQSKDIEKITYRRKGKNWFVLSGYIGSDIVYIKTYVGKGAINQLYITYPVHQKEAYNKAVTRISRSFKPGDLNAAH